MSVERVEGPTPAGGAYAELYRDEHGRPVETVEYAADGTVLQRTYAVPMRAETDGLIGDGLVELRPGDDGYDQWAAWREARRSSEQAER